MWLLPQGLEVLRAILQQGGKGGSLMIMGDFPARPAPEPLDPVRGYPETLSLHCHEITQHPCGNETPDDYNE